MKMRDDSKHGKPKILLLDIETAPNIAHVWSLWGTDVGLSQLMEPHRMLCWSAKWHGEKKVSFDSEWNQSRVKTDGSAYTPSERRVLMAAGIVKLLDEADIVVHYNGTSFDIPHIMREAAQAGMDPPSPFRQVDLRLLVKSRFRFVSNKLDHVAEMLGLGKKLKHDGHEMWVGCMSGDKKSQKKMEEYNRRDVTLLEALYDRLLPWINNHPSVSIYSKDGIACNNCGSSHVQSRGETMTNTGSYARYKCITCGAWFRGSKAIKTAKLRGVSR